MSHNAHRSLNSEAVADVAPEDARCLTWSEAVWSSVPNGIRTRAAALKARNSASLDTFQGLSLSAETCYD
jgi:hypothetical protein